MAEGSEDHFTDSRELYVLIEADEWAHSIAWLPVPQAEPNSDSNSRPARGTSIGTPSGAETLAAQGIPDLQPGAPGSEFRI